MSLAALLDRYAAREDFSTLTLHKTGQGFQANARVGGSSSFRVRIEPTASAALEALLADDKPAGVFD